MRFAPCASFSCGAKGCHQLRQRPCAARPLCTISAVRPCCQSSLSHPGMRGEHAGGARACLRPTATVRHVVPNPFSHMISCAWHKTKGWRMHEVNDPFRTVHRRQPGRVRALVPPPENTKEIGAVEGAWLAQSKDLAHEIQRSGTNLISPTAAAISPRPCGSGTRA